MAVFNRSPWSFNEYTMGAYIAFADDKISLKLANIPKTFFFPATLEGMEQILQTLRDHNNGLAKPRCEVPLTDEEKSMIVRRVLGRIRR